MDKMSKEMLEFLKKEASEEPRPSIDEMIKEMDYKLNKRISLLENRMSLHMLMLSRSMFTPPDQTVQFIIASFQAIRERISLQRMPASPLFEKGGIHHKFTVDEESGEIIIKHPQKLKSKHNLEF